MRRRRSAAVLVLAAGSILTLVGLIGLLNSSGDRTSTEASDPAPTLGPTAAPQSTSTTTPTDKPSAPTAGPTREPTPSASPTTTPEPEDPELFLSEILTTGIRTGDVDGLFDRLHPQVFQVFSADDCRSTLAEVADPAFELTIREVAAPAPWVWPIDGLEIDVADAVAVEVSRLVENQTIIQEMHIAMTDGTWRWFTDCGDPLEGAGQ
jgi:hypothetical protein